MPGHSVTVATADGSGLEAYLAVPGTGSGPGLVLFPESSEADRDAHEIADLFAGEGYVVLCPNGKFDATNIADVTATIRALRQRNVCTGKAGVLGFGHGGKLAYLAAARAGADGRGRLLRLGN
jgi:carboxymethylenebutenolidase